ncbi:MAG: hypothetical protein K1Y36_25845 [Blastocatellia bacterium]|nr:hypothetical protein [Blastocatellia bacterium]
MFSTRNLVLPALFCLVSGVFQLPNYAQTAPQAEEILTNDTIITLTKAGLNSSILVNKIQTSKTSFTLTVEELLRLKKENVADEVVNAMLQTAKPLTSGKAMAKTDPNDPTTPHPAGIYWMREEAGARELLQMDPSVYSQSKSGGVFKSAMTMGIAKVKSKAVIAGERSKFRISHPAPVFYFYFEGTNAGLSESGNSFQASSTTPNEFVLVKMEPKGNSRELVVGQMNAFGAQSGTLDKYVQQFDYEKVAPGIFKVKTKGLTEGEYCFYYAGNTPMPTYGVIGSVGGGKVFDFGVTLKGQ